MSNHTCEIIDFISASIKHSICIGNSMILSAIWKRPQNSPSPKDECYLRSLKNPQVQGFFPQNCTRLMLLLINNIHDKIMQN